MLNDAELKTMADALAFTTFEGRFPFDAQTQIKHHSIYLRLDSRCWRQKRCEAPIDLNPTALLASDPQKWWQRERRKRLDLKDYIFLRPGELLLAQSYESFKVPAGMVAKVLTPESYARLGLKVSGEQKCLPPGWQGQVALELFNYNIHPLRLYALLPIVRLLLFPVEVSAAPHEPPFDYFLKDSGGPFYWWREHIVCSLRARMKQGYLSESDLNFLKEKLDQVHSGGLFRFDRLLFSYPAEESLVASALIQEFCRLERRRQCLDRLRRGLKKSILPVCFILAALSLAFTSIRGVHYTLIAATFIAIYPTFKGFAEVTEPFFTDL